MTKIYFASNRNVLHEESASGGVFGERFNADGPQCFRVGKAEVALAGKATNDTGWTVKATELFPEMLEGEAGREKKVGSARMFEELRKDLKRSSDRDHDVIVYLHGFNSSFPEAVSRAAQLQALYRTDRKDVTVILFSWPSNGRAAPQWEYFSDREDAEASGIAMGRALLKLVSFLTDLQEKDQEELLKARRKGEVADPDKLRQCNRKLHVVAHSMGNWALRHAIQKFVSLNDRRVPRVFDCVFLMAADEDNDAMHQPAKLKPLEQLANRIFVYHSRNDIALTISDATKSNPDRLGSDGPINLDLVGNRVYAVSCRLVSETTLADGHHQYFRKRPEVIADVQATLSGVPQNERPGRRDLQPGRSWELLSAKA